MDDIYQDITITSVEMAKILSKKRIEFNIESRRRPNRTDEEMAAEASKLKLLLEEKKFLNV